MAFQKQAIALFTNISDPESYFRGKRVLVMGLGLQEGGVGIVKFLAKYGAKIKVTDLRRKKELKESLEKLKNLEVEYILGKHREQDFKNTDLIIKNPAVSWGSPYLKITKKYKIPIDTDIGIFFKLCKAPIIGITGTKGKSTTASLIYKFLLKKYKNAILAGNIGVSPLECLNRIKDKTFVVLELSSWQLEGLALHKKSPKIAVITTVFPDHLNRYRSFKHYIESKKLIYKFQKKNGLLFLNFDDKVVKNFWKNAQSKPIFFSKTRSLLRLESKTIGAWVDKEYLVYGKKKTKIIALKDIKLMGEHNLSNILAAVSVGCFLGIPSKSISKALKEFRGIKDRLEFVKTIEGIKFYNDTTATTPDSVIFALEALDPERRRNIILIAGGEDKGLNYKKLAKTIPKHVKYLILFSGSASRKIFNGLAPIFFKDRIISAKNMKEAVKKAYTKSDIGDIILLSPGAASFNMFKNEFDRGKQFMEAVNNIKTK